jgi:hypothetical protein
MVKNRTRIASALGVFFLLTFLGACQPALRKEPVSSKKEMTAPLSVSVEALDRRILYLNRVLETQDLSGDDRGLALDLLAAYRGLKTASQTGSLAQNYSPMINILLKNLEQMENRYFTKKFEAPRLSSEGVHQLANKRKKILEAYSAGDDQAVIDRILDLEKTFGPDSLTPDLSLLLALSLGKKGTFTTALSVGQDAASQLEGKPDLLQLRAQMIDWQLALGNDKEAKEIYDRLQSKLTERDTLVKAMEQKVAPGGSRVTLPETAPGGDLAKADVERDLKEALARVDESVQKGDFGRAKFILLQQRIRLQEGPEAELIDQALKKVEMEEEKVREQEKAGIAAKGPSSADVQKELRHEAETQDGLKVALNLIRSEKYEEALQKLDELPPADPEARELRNSTVEKIINRERDKAARMFLNARNTKNPAKKEELLNSSYNTLKAVADKYPSSPLIPKVYDHMLQVTKELAKLKKGEG